MSDYFVHDRAWCESCHIGDNTRIWAFTHVMKGAQIGCDCNIGEHCYIENDVKIGNRVTIKNGISVWDGVILEDNVFLGPHMVMTNDLRPRSKNSDYEQKKTLFSEGSSVGANATLLCGITIGRYSMVGAGSVVTKSVGDYWLVYGNPAKHKGYVCECGENLDFINDHAKCDCNREFKLNNTKVMKIKG